MFRFLRVLISSVVAIALLLGGVVGSFSAEARPPLPKKLTEEELKSLAAAEADAVMVIVEPWNGRITAGRYPSTNEASIPVVHHKITQGGVPSQQKSSSSVPSRESTYFPNKPATGKNLKITIATADGNKTVPVHTMQDLLQYGNASTDYGNKSNDIANEARGKIFEFRPEVQESFGDLARIIFSLTGSREFSSCYVLKSGDPPRGNLYCEFMKNPFFSTEITDTFIDATSDFKVPFCFDQFIDSGPGETLVIDQNMVHCVGSLSSAPVRFEVDRRYADTIKYGFPDIDSRTGNILYSAPDAAADVYMPMRVWAIAADGTTSFPFYVIIRNRHRPQVVNPGTIEAITGVDTVVSPEQLFTDKDIDLYYSETGDQLTSSVVTNAEHGFAWFDAAGKFHYQSAPMEGKFVDHVTVKTVDRFGLPSQELTLTIQVGDVIPTCQTGGTSTDSHTPVRIELFCSLTPPDGWHQIKGIEISIIRPPQFGTITNLDPVSGSLTYTPDPAHPGPVTFDFQADNNGATRTTQHTIDVYGIPEPEPEPTPPPTP